jgi:hypothetical protein
MSQTTDPDLTASAGKSETQPVAAASAESTAGTGAATATEDGPVPPAPTGEPFSWAPSKADWKSLIVGVIGSLVTVVIVAIALIVNRHLGTIRLSAVGYLAIAGCFAVLGTLASVTRKVRVLGTVLVLLFFGVFVLGVVFALLLVVGQAAGIH